MKMTEDDAILRFEVVAVTSEDPNYSASELLQYRNDGKGWRSEEEGQSPQEIVLRLLHPRSSTTSSTIHLSTLRILAHEYMIPQKIEIVVASNNGGPVETFDNCSVIRRLGYVALATNETSNYQARELKSISIGSQEADFIKLCLYDCHPNELNVNNQVAIAGIELHGSIMEDHREQRQEEVETQEPLREEVVEDDNETVQASRVVPDSIDKGAFSQSRTSPPPATAQELMSQKKRSDTTCKRRLDRLNQIKLERAALEDFECAAKIKAVMDDTKSAFNKLNDLEAKMREASDSEDYCEAARIKKERDYARNAAMESLDEAESAIGELRGIDIHREGAEEESKSESESVAVPPSSVHKLEFERAKVDYPPHTCERSPTEHDYRKQDDSRTAASTTSSSAEARPSSHVDTWEESMATNVAEPSLEPLPNPKEEREPPPSISTGRASTDSMNSAYYREEESGGRYDDDDAASDNDNDSDSFSAGSSLAYEDDTESRHGYDEDNHPLRDVPGYMDLPAPEDINTEGGEIATDTVGRIQSLLGEYLTKCFFSRNYSLREASLAKVSLLLPEIMSGSTTTSTNDQAEADTKSHLKTICIMLERAMDDRVIPVFVAALILLDDCLAEFEESGMSSREVASHLSVIAPSLVRHLGDNKAKVVEGAETALLSMALSDCIGPAYIANHITKRTTEMKAGRAIIARMNVLKTLLIEFGGGQGIRVHDVMEFVSEHGIGHKDTEVRDAAKDVAISASKIIGRDVEHYLDKMSDRQRKGVLAAALKQPHPQNPTRGAHEDDYLTLPANSPSPARLKEQQQSRGRGRGRSRVHYE